MRVALLSHNARSADAVGRQIAEKAAFFLERGADLRLFVESDRRLHPALAHVARVIDADRVPEGEWSFLCSADLVIAEYSQDFPLLGLLPLLAERNVRILFDYHGVTPPQWQPVERRELLERSILRRGLVCCADAVLVHSRCARTDLKEFADRLAGRLYQLGYPVDGALFHPGACTRSLKDRLGIGNAPLLLFVGRLAPNKRLPVLIEAVARLPAVHASIVGDASDIYAVEAERCRRLAAERGIADRVHFLGQLDDPQLADAYRSADVFVTPSLHEAFCIPVIEAMASGLPVVAARAAALPQTIGSGGLTFHLDDPDDLVRKVRMVLDTIPLTPSSRAASREQKRPRTGCESGPLPRGRGSGKPFPPLPLGEGMGVRDWERVGVRGDVRPPFRTLRVAVVAVRYGLDFVGGAETSLRTIAESLKHAGQHVEVFTTCTREESAWKNQLPTGTAELNGISVHRFPIDPHDRQAHCEIVRKALDPGEILSPDEEQEYVRHSVHSTQLLESLGGRLADFDAVVAGPYLFGLVWDVAHRFPEKTLLLPCFHDEPLARLHVFRDTYERVGGLLYHSEEEQIFAEAVLGLNHPGAHRCGTVLPWASREQKRPPSPSPLSHWERVGVREWERVGVRGVGRADQTGYGSPPVVDARGEPLNAPREEGEGLGGRGTTIPSGGSGSLSQQRYVVYCGRYSEQKNLPLLLDWAARYHAEHPGRFRFVFMGEGHVAIPNDPWALDCGFVEESAKRDILAGADLLIQLSQAESLSLAALEAWAQGTPVLANGNCPVMMEHFKRQQATDSVAAPVVCLRPFVYETFAEAMNDLWANPEAWRERGVRGRPYVEEHYGSVETFVRVLEGAIADMRLPWAERLRRRGREIAARHETSRWREDFGRIVETLLDAPSRERRLSLTITPRSARRTIAADQERTQAADAPRALLVPYRITNDGAVPLLPDGPSAVVLRVAVYRAEDEFPPLSPRGRGNGGEGAGVQDVPPRTAVRGLPLAPLTVTHTGEGAVHLPGLLVPGQTCTAAVPVTVPPEPGSYRVIVLAMRGETVLAVSEVLQVAVAPVENSAAGDSASSQPAPDAGAPMFPTSPPRRACAPTLDAGARGMGSSAVLMQAIEEALAELVGLQRLPDDYHDVTEGWFASWKRWIKRKLLGNFKRAYVDVISRRQSAFNQRVISLLTELAEVCSLIDHAHAEEVRQLRCRLQILERRLRERGEQETSEQHSGG